VSELVEAIGAAAGVAAGVGLVLLSALHVSQAREVRRLLARAGRVPRRAWRVPRRAVAVAAGLLVLGGVIAQLTGDDPRRPRPEPVKPKRRAPAVKPAEVTVAVLNGTLVDGLAASLRDELVAAGFDGGVIDVFSDQQRTESVVHYAPGHANEARAVGRTLGISRREPATPDSVALAGGATVIVIAGADRAP
jgi:hypothetical protein